MLNDTIAREPPRDDSGLGRDHQKAPPKSPTPEPRGEARSGRLDYWVYAPKSVETAARRAVVLQELRASARLTHPGGWGADVVVSIGATVRLREARHRRWRKLHAPLPAQPVKALRCSGIHGY